MIWVKLLITNLLRMLIGKKMIIWGLKLASSLTKNKVDDGVVMLAEGALDNDEDKVREAIELLAAQYKKD